ncbi:MAG: hypothetical protein AAF411_25580 [Myxococcota bacterium]
MCPAQIAGQRGQLLTFEVSVEGASTGDLDFALSLPPEVLPVEVGGPRFMVQPAGEGRFTLRVVARSGGRSASCELRLVVAQAVRLACPEPLEGAPRSTLDVRVGVEGSLARSEWRAVSWPDGENPPRIETFAEGTAAVTLRGAGTYELVFEGVDAAGNADSCEVVIRAVGEPVSAVCPGPIEGEPNQPTELLLASDESAETLSWTLASRPRTSRLAEPLQDEEGRWFFTPDAVGIYRMAVSLRSDGVEEACDVRFAVRNHAALRVEMAWDTDENVNLRVGNPTARTTGTDRPNVCFPRNCDRSRGLVLEWGDRANPEDDPRLERDMQAFGPENFVLPEIPLEGTYLVGVGSFSNTPAEVAVYCGGAELEPTRVLEPMLRLATGFVVAEVDIAGDECAVRLPTR